MSSTRKNEFIAGLVVVAAILALLGMTFVIRGNTGMNPYRIQVIYPNVVGLEIGSPVLVSGFRIGRVVKMEPARSEEGDPQVRVSAVVSREIPIYKDAEVRLAQQGFLGDMRLEVDPGNPSTGEIGENELLKSIPPIDISAVFANAGDIMSDVQETIRGIRDVVTDEERIASIDSTINHIDQSAAELNMILRDNRENVRDTITNIRELSDETRDMATRVDSILEKADIQISDLGAIAEETLAQLREDTRALTGKVDELLTKAEGIESNANQLLLTGEREIQEISDGLQQTNASIQELLVNVNEGRGTVGKLITDPKPFEDLRESITALRGFLLKESDSLYDRDAPYRQPAAGGADAQ